MFNFVLSLKTNLFTRTMCLTQDSCIVDLDKLYRHSLCNKCTYNKMLLDWHDTVLQIYNGVLKYATLCKNRQVVNYNGMEWSAILSVNGEQNVMKMKNISS